MPFTVAIVGRPNVGKSTLFNRLCRRRSAIVDPTPGVTRDRREGEARLGHLRFIAIDTAGFEDAAEGSMQECMRVQTERAIAESDVALMLIDARAGITPLDREVAGWLRRAGARTVLVANKCEGKGGDAGLIEAYSLGLGEPVAISAEHGDGMADLVDAMAEAARDAGIDAEAPDTPVDREEGEADTGEGPPPRALQLAILGRPNVGKSTLVNRLLGEERVITGPEPGVTRDAIAIEWEWRGRPIRLIDTAGIRRRARVVEAIEKLSVADALNAIRFAHVVVLVLDAEEGLERQDLTLASMVMEEGRALVIAANKWDLVSDPQTARRQIDERLEQSLAQARGIPVVQLSAISGQGVDKLLPAVVKLFDTWNRRLPTGKLNQWLDTMLERHPPPSAGGRAVRLRYITQVKARPPSFALFVNRADALAESYQRFLINGLRQAFKLDGVPIRLLLRTGRNPYAAKAKDQAKGRTSARARK